MTAGSAGPSTPVAVLDPFTKQKAEKWGVVAAVVIVLAILGGLAATGVLKFKGSPMDPTLRAQGSDQLPVLQAQGTDSAPVLKAPDRPRMPDDVRAWLEHLRKCEEKRVEIATNQLTDLALLGNELKTLNMTKEFAQDLMNDPTGPGLSSPAEPVREKATDVSKPWQDLTAFFNSVVPPAECVPIRDKYDQPLRETGAIVLDIAQILADPTDAQALSKLKQISTNNKKVIDIPAGETDDMVARICDKYGERKWFSITANVGGGAVMSAGGF